MAGRFDHAVGVRVHHYGPGHGMAGGVHRRAGTAAGALVAQWRHGRPGGGRSRRASGRRAGLDLGCGGRMTVVEGILLAVSIAVFLYLGVAMFKPEWF